MTKRSKPTRYRLGGGHGTITLDGRQATYKGGLLAQGHFTVDIDALYHFKQERECLGLICTLHIMSVDDDLAPVVQTTGRGAEKIEAWFRQQLRRDDPRRNRVQPETLL